MEENTTGGFFKRIAAGILICAGAIIPGISGGVIAMALGIYERIASAVYGLVREFKRSALFLAPLAIGGIIGTLGMASALTWLMARYKTPVLLTFMGLVIGGMPGIIREANRDGFRPRYLLAALGGIVLFSVLAFGDRELGLATDVSQGLTLFESFASGVIAALGTIVPGVSTSFLLMLLNWYEPFMAAIASLDLRVLIPGILGFGLTTLALLKVVNFIFSRVRAYGYWAVSGFTAGSAVFLLVQVLSSGFLWWHLIFLLLGLAAGYFVFSGAGKKAEN